MLFVMVIENRKPVFSNGKITFSYFTCEQDYRLRDFPVDKTNKTKLSQSLSILKSFGHAVPILFLSLGHTTPYFLS